MSSTGQQSWREWKSTTALVSADSMPYQRPRHLPESPRLRAAEDLEAERTVVQQADAAPPTPRQGRDPFDETNLEHLFEADLMYVGGDGHGIGYAELDRLLQTHLTSNACKQSTLVFQTGWRKRSCAVHAKIGMASGPMSRQTVQKEDGQLLRFTGFLELCTMAKFCDWKNGGGHGIVLV